MEPTANPEEPSGETSQSVDLHGGSIGHLEADTVHIARGGATSIQANQVEISMGAAGEVEGGEVDLSLAAAMAVRGEQVTTESTVTGVLVGDQVVFSGSHAAFAVAGKAEMDHSSAVVLLAREVHGQVEPVLDARGAMLFGLAAGVAAGMVLWAGRMLLRRR